jgi:hypothetical protein
MSNGKRLLVAKEYSGARGEFHVADYLARSYFFPGDKVKLGRDLCSKRMKLVHEVQICLQYESCAWSRSGFYLAEDTEYTHACHMCKYWPKLIRDVNVWNHSFYHYSRFFIFSASQFWPK